MEDAVETANHLGTEIGVERRCLFAETREHQTAIACDPQLLQAALFWVEISRHPRRIFEAPPKRHSPQVAPRIVAPLMIRTDVGPRVAVRLAAHPRASVRAAIDPHGEAAVLVARYDHRGGAHERAFEVAWVGHLRFQSDKAPRRPTKDPLQLQLVDFR